jgi:hypothetical protein
MSFCGYLKADTQVIVTIGPFVDVSDGFTPQTDITLGGNEAELIKHGSTSVVDISGATWAAVANCRGYYSLTLTTSHTDTEGMLTVIVQDDSDCLPVRNTFEVVNANVYDSLFAAATTDYLQVDTIQVSGTSQTANDNGADINDILVDTNELQGDWTNTGRLDTILDSILTDTGTTLDGKINTIDTVVDAVKAKTDSLTFTVANQVDANAVAVSASAATADRLEAWMNAFLTGVVELGGGPTTTVFQTNAGEATNDHFNNMIIVFTGGALLGQARRISDYVGATGTITVEPALTEAPAADDTWIIFPMTVGGIDASGRVDVGRILGTAQTAGDVTADTAAILLDTSTTLDNLVDDLESRIGTPSDFGSGTSTIAANLQDLADNGTATFDRSTDSLQAIRDHVGDGTNLTEAGATGNHLSAIPWNSAWDVEVQSEVADALDAAIPANPTAMSANDMMLRSGTAVTSNMTINETSGAYSMKAVNDEGAEETFGNSKAASGTITSSAGTTTRNPT